MYGRLWVIIIACLGIGQLGGVHIKDPVSWTRSGSIPASTILYSTYTATYYITNNLGIAIPSPVKFSNSTEEFQINNGCVGSLAPGATCSITIKLIPKVTGKKTFNISLVYGYNTVHLPELETDAEIGAPSISVQTLAGLPPFTRIGNNYEVKVKFINSGGSEAVNLDLIRNYSNHYTETSNTCGDSLAEGESCQVTGIFSATTEGHEKVALTLNYNRGSVSTAMNTKVVEPGLGRILTFVNQCDEDVWFGIHGGVADNICVNDTDCPVGSSCRVDAAAGNGICYWPNPIPNLPRNEYMLTARGGVNYTLLLDVDPEEKIIWSGDVAGRTGCVGGSCETADCHSEGGDHECPLGVDFDKPATLASLTLFRRAPDIYKIDASYGVNLPMSITPTNVAASTTQPYFCGSPGAINPSHASLRGCTWTFAPPSVEYVHVKAITAKTCISDADCRQGLVCGLAYDATKIPAFQKICGKKTGYWTANEACSLSADEAQPYFHCKNELSAMNNFTLAALYSCATPDKGDALLNSCYGNYSGKNNLNTCCGCTNWSDLGINVSASCQGQNPEWVAQVLPGVQWLKQACSTMAVYPKDEKSSVFTCQSNANIDNQVDYTVTFCPRE